MTCPWARPNPPRTRPQASEDRHQQAARHLGDAGAAGAARGRGRLEPVDRQSAHLVCRELPGAIFKADEPDELILQSIRLPRVVLALCVGAALAVAGALMQAVAANPLAAPEIMGVNAGAVFVVVLAITVVPSLSGAPTILLAFGGAAAAGVSVMLLAGSGRGRVSPVRLALAGVTASSLLISLTQVLIIFDENSTDSVLFWLVGGVNFAGWHDIRNLLPWLVLGLARCVRDGAAAEPARARRRHGPRSRPERRTDPDARVGPGDRAVRCGGVRGRSGRVHRPDRAAHHPPAGRFQLHGAAAAVCGGRRCAGAVRRHPCPATSSRRSKSPPVWSRR